MKEIYLFTDEYWIPNKLHVELKTNLQKINGLRVFDERGDSSAKGGVIWFAAGYVIEIGVLSASVLGILLFDKVLAKITEILSSAEFKNSELNFYLGEDGQAYKSVQKIYFSFDSKDAPYSEELVKMAIKSIPEAQEDLKRILNSNFLSNYNYPKEIVMNYDIDFKKWFIRHFDINTKIYFNKVTQEYSPNSFNPFIHFFNKIMKIFYE